MITLKIDFDEYDREVAQTVNLVRYVFYNAGFNAFILAVRKLKARMLAKSASEDPFTDRKGRLRSSVESGNATLSAGRLRADLRIGMNNVAVKSSKNWPNFHYVGKVDKFTVENNDIDDDLKIYFKDHSNRGWTYINVVRYYAEEIDFLEYYESQLRQQVEILSAKVNNATPRQRGQYERIGREMHRSGRMKSEAI